VEVAFAVFLCEAVSDGGFGESLKDGFGYECGEVDVAGVGDAELESVVEAELFEGEVVLGEFDFFGEGAVGSVGLFEGDSDEFGEDLEEIVGLVVFVLVDG